ncbi:tRNA (adenosine(37)-N6)-threonylcarbamoyltransferase complex dimerization subunit type 1 TsaB [Paracoccus sp. R86501]|uniref:tRNA (adenosine(37)-N6)-threonylcarbamoyltransferase complex dimerization subunit type 1 TsaB n=1 Tax=Paracoccus sp. R86501 TaxID=3101711 RepID=UPI00366C2845
MPDRLTLGFDTSAAHCAAALLRGDRVLVQRREEMTKGQAERLMPLLEEVLADAGVTWRDIDVIGVGTGPGNFTGVRIAVAAARGLALSLKIPAIGISATEAAAHDVPRPCRIVIPTRGDEVIWQDFTAEDSEGGRPQQAATGALPPGPAPAAPAVPTAVAIAHLAAARADIPAPRPAPLYMRPADAAPARDAPPVILP